MEIKLAPSILAADFSRLYQDVQAAEEAGAEYIHFDVMDGNFVPNISFGAPVIKALRGKSRSFFDVHMMVTDPERYLEDLCGAGADRITIHQEACRHLDRALHQIDELGIKAGIALNPSTPVETLEHVLPLADLVLIMSVNPGFGGQKLIPYTLEKISRLRKIREERKLDFSIGIDGGVNIGNVREVIRSGADFIVAGSAVFQPQETIAGNTAAFMELMEERD